MGIKQGEPPEVAVSGWGGGEKSLEGVGGSRILEKKKRGEKGGIYCTKQ